MVLMAFMKFMNFMTSSPEEWKLSRARMRRSLCGQSAVRSSSTRIGVEPPAKLFIDEVVPAHGHGRLAFFSRLGSGPCGLHHLGAFERQQREGIDLCMSQIFPDDEVVRVMLRRKASQTKVAIEPIRCTNCLAGSSAATPPHANPCR